MKIIAVIVANEFSGSTYDIKVLGLYTTYEAANKAAAKKRVSLHKSRSLGWMVWTQETELTEAAP